MDGYRQQGHKCADCVTALGNLLQPLFRNTKTTWPLSDELNYLKNYLRIMNYRTGTPIDFTSEIDPSILPCLMPKFILQPLLENAISHQNPSPEVKNTITLTGHREDNTIFLVLTDNASASIRTDCRFFRNFWPPMRTAPNPWTGPPCPRHRYRYPEHQPPHQTPVRQCLRAYRCICSGTRDFCHTDSCKCYRKGIKRRRPYRSVSKHTPGQRLLRTSTCLSSEASFICLQILLLSSVLRTRYLPSLSPHPHILYPPQTG